MRVVSLFSGCGGMDIGFIWAGYKIIWANDIDPDACATYRLNIGNHIIEEDIANVDLSTIPDCDVILGGFPCQDFSMIWKRRGIETNRGNLYQYFVKAVNIKQPRFFVAENVRGLLTANKGKAIEQIIKDFKNCGYNIYPDIYNFADYGTPQLRERVLIIGIRKDISYYYPQHELEWEGEIFVLVKLHIKETFLYKAIKAGLQLASLNLNESLGWLEIRGVISKDEFQKGYLGEQLPDKT